VGRVGAAHIGKVIAWAGVMTYGAMAIGAPLGVWIVHLGGLATLSWTIVVVALIALCLAWRKPGVAASSSSKVPFQQVLGKILPYGVVLALASCGFGVIATFITLFYAAHHWAGAAFSLTSFSCAFVGIRLIFSNAIGRFGGLRVTLACFVVEAAGLLLVWGANSPWMAMLGATLTGCGFSLIFPALGVVAVKTMPAEHRGSALATYTLFLDLSLGVTGPLAGGLISYMGIDAIYLAAALTSLLAFLLVIHQINTEKKQHQAIQPATH
jgi:predicted MFS family arabinose efflux permease